MKRLLLALLVSVMAASCAHVISQETRSKARTDVRFADVARNPYPYKGYLFLWGGTIVKTRLTDNGSVIEVVQGPLDRYGAIADPDVSEGRFLVFSKRHLDPLIYENGREITVAGVLVGSEKSRLGDVEYTYPVLEAREIFLWKEEQYYYPPYYSPYYSPYYDPWYYDPWYYDPWYYDPWYYDRWYYGPPRYGNRHMPRH